MTNKTDNDKIIEILKQWSENLKTSGKAKSRERFLKQYNLPKKSEEIVNNLIDDGAHFIILQAPKSGSFFLIFTLFPTLSRLNNVF